jgi:hypothetical protein
LAPAGDLSEKIGGLMMLDAIDMLEADEGTQVIALISKPPRQPWQKKCWPAPRLPQAGGCLLPRPQ